MNPFFYISHKIYSLYKIYFRSWKIGSNLLKIDSHNYFLKNRKRSHFLSSISITPKIFLIFELFNSCSRHWSRTWTFHLADKSHFVKVGRVCDLIHLVGTFITETEPKYRCLQLISNLINHPWGVSINKSQFYVKLCLFALFCTFGG